MKYFQTQDLLQHTLGRGEGTGGCGWTSEARPAMSRSLLQLAAGTTGSQSKSARVWLTKMAPDQAMQQPWRPQLRSIPEESRRRPPLIPHTLWGAVVTWQPPCCPIARLLSPFYWGRGRQYNFVVKCTGVGLPLTCVQIMTLPLS